MYTTTNRDIVDARIHRFMSRKSADKTVSEMIAEYIVAPETNADHKPAGVAYEQTSWRHKQSF